MRLLDGWEPDLTGPWYWVLAGLNLLSFAHLLFLLFGFASAGALVLGWRIPYLLVALVPPLILTIALAVLGPSRDSDTNATTREYLTRR